MKVYHIILVVFVLSNISCREDKREVDEPIKKEKAISIADTLSLRLNAVNKWLVNSETHEGVNKMDSIISQFETKGNMSYKELGEALSKQTSYIIKNCTMTGEPHDQLHVVLVPMLDEISILRETDSETESVHALSNLTELIEAYYQYFKL
ncbi:hypothetical protein [Hanstruepera marina]|uniref:hypothetical protein n=1 Tax=Hanstruepera marina TaxID=2873265 RepID=UPI001CA71ACD|nr:hypothetical protein [Hanstruepera marina]